MERSEHKSFWPNLSLTFCLLKVFLKCQGLIRRRPSAYDLRRYHFRKSSAH